MPGICWLASYPKSGNTWFRAFLANYMSNPAAPIPINDLPNFIKGDGTAWPYEKLAGGPVGDMSVEEIQQLRLKVHMMFATSSSDTVFVKTHNAIALLDDVPTISPEATAGAIYIIRNPLDVAVSYAHQYGVDYDRTAEIFRSEYSLLPNHGHLVVQFLGSWSGHVRSWLDAPGLKLHLIRYEDMARNPGKAFRGAIKFLGLPLEAPRLKNAIRFSSFKTLAQQEKAGGFVEAVPVDNRVFFRKGKVGDWRNHLSAAQADRLIEDHHEVMAEHGYLTKDGRPVF